MMPLPPIVTRWLTIGAIGAALFAFGWLQGAHREQIKAERFEAATESLGKAQAARTAEINRRQQQNHERAKHELRKTYQAAADNAVRNYLARTRWLRHDEDPGRGPMPGPAGSDAGNDAAGRECLAAGQPDHAFIEACARDAGRLGVWQSWAVDNQVPVE